jgi:hypothetical protein
MWHETMSLKILHQRLTTTTKPFIAFFVPNRSSSRKQAHSEPFSIKHVFYDIGRLCSCLYNCLVLCTWPTPPKVSFILRSLTMIRDTPHTLWRIVSIALDTQECCFDRALYDSDLFGTVTGYRLKMTQTIVTFVRERTGKR